MSAWSQSRVQALEQVFAHIAATHMRDVPVQNHALRVQAVSFAPQADPAGGEWLLGVLVTPWFMNLVCLPMDLAHAGETVLGVGQKAKRQVGSESFEFIGAHENGVGAFACCSLFSPMFEFADHATAVATAREVLSLLRTPAPAPALTTTQKPAPALDAKAEAAPSRRGFLFGRGGPRAGASA
jgi:[NiFe] hydrogenase assembly HybE family chaperone